MLELITLVMMLRVTIASLQGLIGETFSKPINVFPINLPPLPISKDTAPTLFIMKSPFLGGNIYSTFMEGTPMLMQIFVCQRFWEHAFALMVFLFKQAFATIFL